jgi:hypothetical protein
LGAVQQIVRALAPGDGGDRGERQRRKQPAKPTQTPSLCRHRISLFARLNVRNGPEADAGPGAEAGWCQLRASYVPGTSSPRRLTHLKRG